MSNIILNTDSYKLSHNRQLPPKTEKVYSYFESRVGAKFPTTTFFGLQYLIKKHLTGKVVTHEKIAQAKAIAAAHFGSGSLFNAEGWHYILGKHKGYLPISIRAVPEGMSIPESNVLMTVENTDPAVPWLTNYLETLLSHVWYSSTVCTLSREVKKIILAGLEKTGDPAGIGFKLHDFGYRGSTSVESAGIGGLAHLVNFLGTDTLAALETGMEYYDSEVMAFSIPASEHSTITSWGGPEKEVDAFRNMLEQYPSGLVACVSDSFDIERACTDLWGNELREKVLARDGVLVVRPDSGEIVSTVLNVLSRLGNAFGTTVNSKGYKVLNPKVRMIQGDGCSIHTIQEVIRRMAIDKWSVDNIAFGMGGGLLQKMDRDTQRFAFKCSSVTIDGKEQDVYKSPKTDMTKASKRGRLELIRVGSEYKTVRAEEVEGREVVMREVFRDGILLNDEKFQTIRDRAAL